MKKYDLSWGDTACIRQAFTDAYDGNEFVFDRKKMNKMGYTPHYGDEKLIEMTRKIIERQVYKTYKHVILTNGATGGITIALRAYAQKGRITVITNEAPYFPLYPTMFRAAGLKHNIIEKHFNDRISEIALVDSPSNPLGAINKNSKLLENHDVIWDAVYYNNIYAPDMVQLPLRHDVMVGSYSKLLGLNGIRIGWIATDDSLLYERIKSLIDGEYAGLSGPSMDLLVHILDGGFSWELFEKYAKNNLNRNREEWSKLERYFDGNAVNPIGMFYYSNMDNTAKKLFDKSGIEWLPGSVCGTSDEFGRFNLGQDCMVIVDAVKTVLKNDKI